MTIAQIVTLAIQVIPEIGQAIANLVAAGKTSDADIATALADLDASDADVAAAYANMFPGQTPPTP